MNPRIALTFALTVLLAAACGKLSSTAAPRPYTQQVGLGSEGHVRTMLPRILDRHGYLLERASADEGSIRMVSTWRRRGAFDDESAYGIRDGQIRVTVTGLPRSSSAGRLYRLELRAENLTRVHPDSAYVPTAPSRMLLVLLDELAADLRSEFNTGRHVLRR